MKLILFLITFLFALAGQAQVKKTIFGDNVRRTTIYPNPARSFVSIQYKHTAMPAILVIYNFMGKKLLVINQPGANVYIDLAGFNRGIYVFQFKDRNGQLLDTGKFQVEK
ncbi:MAG: hypothetical protein RLZZ420_2333 [Bacteroidota bacterium]|jgi:type III secretory pathway component EscU